MDENAFWDLVAELDAKDFDMEPYEAAKSNWTALTDIATNGATPIAN